MIKTTTLTEDTNTNAEQSPVLDIGLRSTLDEIVLKGAQDLLQQALEREIEEARKRINAEDSDSPSSVTRAVRNGYNPQRDVHTGAGKLKVRQPRLRDREGKEHFTSKILPPYMRRAPSLDALIPALYLYGVSTSDFSDALESILGPHAKGLSSTNITHLKGVWQQEWDQWRKRDLSDKHYVYIWADGIHFNVRLEDERTCILVLIGATIEGEKELIAVEDGFRESTQSWKQLLSDVKERGLQKPPKLAIGDGALGFWKALEEDFASTKHQRCWVHKKANILDKLPKSQQARANTMIDDIYQAATKNEAEKAYAQFIEQYEDKYPKAAGCLQKDKQALFSFYDFPAKHWQHIRTTNPIESTFATVRHRTRKTKGCGSRAATLTMVFKLAKTAQKRWRRLRGYQLIDKIINGVQFVDGEEQNHQHHHTA